MFIIDFVASIVSYDIWFYAIHYTLHNIYLYSKIHRIHHQIKHNDLTFFNSYTSHIIEKPLSYAGALIPYLFICPSPNYYAILLSLLFINIRDALRHDKRFIHIVGDHHLLHHQYPQYNFGEEWLDNFFWTKYYD